MIEKIRNKLGTRTLTLGIKNKILPRSKRSTRVCTRNAIKNFALCKRSQEEMVGFAIIMVIVFVIMLVFLGFSMSNSNKEAVESYEANSFVQSMLAYTTTCDDYREVYLKTQDLIFKCDSNKTCVNGNSSCEILVTTLKGILMGAWNVEGNSSIKGYSLKIGGEGKELVSLEKGNVTRNSKGASQRLPRGGKIIEVSFVVYY